MSIVKGYYDYPSLMCLPFLLSTSNSSSNSITSALYDIL